ncbi:MAG: hypothetical protein ACT4OP_02065 [Actinomycetota bacterium]
MSGLLKYRGRLAVRDYPADISVDLRVDGGTLELLTSQGSLGVWPLAHVSVWRMEDGRFGLDLANEEAYFKADDPLGFSYVAVQAIEAEQSSLRSRLRAFIPVGRPVADKAVVVSEPQPAARPVKAYEAVRARAPRHLKGAEAGA